MLERLSLCLMATLQGRSSEVLLGDCQAGKSKSWDLFQTRLSNKKMGPFLCPLSLSKGITGFHSAMLFTTKMHFIPFWPNVSVCLLKLLSLPAYSEQDCGSKCSGNVRFASYFYLIFLLRSLAILQVDIQDQWAGK